MDHFTCGVCGKQHTAFFGLDAPPPDAIVDLEGGPDNKRVETVGEMYVIDRTTLFVKGVISVPTQLPGEPAFRWYAWVSLPVSAYANKFELLSSGESIELRAEMATSIPLFPALLGLDAIVRFQIEPEFEILIEVTGESELRDDQAEPVSRDRAIEIMQRIHHFNVYREKLDFASDFQSRLHEAIAIAGERYVSTNAYFFINISNIDDVLFQIVSSEMLEPEANDPAQQAGFALHLSFDNSFIENIEPLANFRRTEFFEAFTHIKLDGVPTYQLDVGMDIDRLCELVELLVREVYQERLEDVEVCIPER